MPDTGLFGALAVLAARRRIAGELIGLGPDRYAMEVSNASSGFHARFGFDRDGILKAAQS